MNQLEQLYRDLSDKYSEENLRLRAREDAAHNLPRADLKEPSPFEIEILNACQTVASKVAGEYRAQLEELDGDIKAEQETAESAHYDALNTIEGVYYAKRQSIDNSFRLRHARQECEEIQRRYNDAYSAVGRIAEDHVPHGLYLLLMSVFFCCLLPLNTLIFPAFGEGEPLSFAVGAIVSLLVPLMGHLIGILLRETRGASAVHYRTFGVLFFLLSFTALFALHRMRQNYLAEFDYLANLNEAPAQLGLLFFLLNTAILFGASVVSFLGHDSVPGYLKLSRGFDRARIRVTAMEQDRVREIQLIDLDKVQELEARKREFRDAINDVTRMKGQYDRILKQGQAQEARCLYLLGQLLAVYRAENISQRTDKLVPASFERNLEFPLQLGGLAEKLNNNADR